jgi:hypothetical protein
MIFKGNTKMTPAITEILDDNTSSNNKTYSSNKIEALISGGGGGGNIILYKKYNNTKWLNKLSTITDLNNYHIEGTAAGVNFISLYIRDFDTINDISDLNNYNFYVKLNTTISTTNNVAPFHSINTTVVSDDSTTKIILGSYMTLNNIKIAEFYGTKNIDYLYGSATIDLSNQLIPINSFTYPNDRVDFKIHYSKLDAYMSLVLNNVPASLYANFDTNNFKSIEILLYAVKK